MRTIVLILCLVFASMGLAEAGTLPATLAWSNPIDVTDGIQVEKSASATGTFATIKQVPSGTITFTDAANNPGETACYRVAYFNPSGIGPYAGPICKTFPTIPAQAPATFTVN